MSIKSWKEEFGQTRKSRIEGLSKENLTKHKIKVSGGMLHEMARVRGCFVPKYKSVFPNGFDEQSIVTDNQRRAYDHWLKTNDAGPLIKAFRPSLLDKFRSLLDINFLSNIAVLM